MDGWDDLRVFLTVAREGSVRGAAQVLKVSHSTVLRRIAALEAELGASLFERSDGRVTLSETGEPIVDAAEIIEEQVRSIERRVSGTDSSLAGRVRLTVPNDVALHLIMEDLIEFSQLYPDIDLDVATGYAYADLTRHEADVALRFIRRGKRPQESLVGRNLGCAYHCVYAPSSLDDVDVAALPWLGWANDGRYPSWVKRLGVNSNPAKHILASMELQQEACAGGLGTAVLSCFLADPDLRLRRIGQGDAWPAYDIWLLTHPDLRDTIRFKRFRDFIADSIKDKAPLLEGRQYKARC